MSDDGLIAFLNARLDEEQDEQERAGECQVAWVSLRLPDGSMGYTTVAARTAPEVTWCANGEELTEDFEGTHFGEAIRPDVERALVVYDRDRQLRDIAADRELLAAYQRAAAERAASEFESDFTQALELAVRIRATRFSDHPDYQPGWNP